MNMKTKIDYHKEYWRLEDAAVNELKEALAMFPNNEYVFMSEEESEHIDDFDNDNDYPVLCVYDFFSDSTSNIYVTRVSLRNGELCIDGYDQECGSYSDARCYDQYDFILGHIYNLFLYLPNPIREETATDIVFLV